VVQLPLPKQINANKILDLIPSDKDVDALSENASVLAPVAGAVREVLERNQVELEGKKILVVGQGRLVGRPVAIWLAQEGYEVETADINTKNLAELTNRADVIITGVGKPGLIKLEDIKEGAILIDTGTSESAGKLMGDVDPTCAVKCSLLSPVPGGVGPITVAMIFKNLLQLVR
jgi:methylenetetrahydrofolate dehydrogenase (NADP+)/methenyltetrahydrofolate cyclohydrolase